MSFHFWNVCLLSLFFYGVSANTNSTRIVTTMLLVHKAIITQLKSNKDVIKKYTKKKANIKYTTKEFYFCLPILNYRFNK
jgi:hypothetical protein